MHSAPADTTDSSIDFRTDIHGLRGVAVAVVVAFHAFPDVVPGGFIGVDVFFVLSGYLITIDILKRVEIGTFSLRGFYLRRARRLLPALYVMLAAVLIVGYFRLDSSSLAATAQNVASTLLFVSNFDLWLTTGYFSPHAELRLLLHTWSLAIEAQFYLAFPLLLVVVHRTRPGATNIVIGIALGGSLAISHALLARNSSSSAAFFLTPPRMYELLVGSLLARLAVQRSLESLRHFEVFSCWARVLCFGVAFLPALLYSSDTLFPGLNGILPVVGVAAFIALGFSRGSLLDRILGATPLQHLGSISYSLYLWHWPLLAIAKHEFGAELTVGQTVGILSIAWIISVLSRRFIEVPFLGGPQDFFPSTISNTVRALAVAASIASVAVALVQSGGAPSRYSSQALAAFDAANDFNPRRNDCHSGEGPSIPYRMSCLFGAPGASPTVAIWGDSHGAELAVALGNAARIVDSSVMQITASSCPPAPGFSPRNRPHCAAHNQEVLMGLRTDRSIETVILAIKPADIDRTQVLEGLARALEGLANAGKNVIVALPIPLMKDDPPVSVGKALEAGKNPFQLGVESDAFYRANQDWVSAVKRLCNKYGATTFDPATHLCDMKRCRMFDASAGVLYFNRDHLSLAGATMAFQELAHILYPKN